MKRNRMLDITRGMAMMGVFLLHFQFVGLYPLGGVLVALFYVISGYLTKPRPDKKVFIRARAKQLLIPYGVTALVMVGTGTISDVICGTGDSIGIVILKWIYAGLYGAGDPYTEPFYIKSIGGIWFLLASFWGAIFMQYIIEMKRIRQLICVAVLFLIGVLTPKLFWFPFSIQAGMCAVFFMYMGYLAKEAVPWLQKQKSLVKGGVLLAAAVAFIWFLLNFKGFWLVHCEFGNGIWDLVGSLGACIWFMVIAGLIDKIGGPLASLLDKMGRYSIVILCVHIVELEAFPWGPVVGAMISHGVSEYAATSIWLRVMKVIWITAGTMLCLHFDATRKIFGLAEKKDERKNQISDKR